MAFQQRQPNGEQKTNFTVTLRSAIADCSDLQAKMMQQTDIFSICYAIDVETDVPADTSSNQAWSEFSTELTWQREEHRHYLD